MQNTPPKRFVIFRPGSLGDTLIVAPILWELKKKYPAASIVYLAEKPGNALNVAGADAARLMPEIEKVYSYNAFGSWVEKFKMIQRDVCPKKGDALLYLCNERANVFQVLRDALGFRLAGFNTVVGTTQTLKDIIFKTPQSEYRRIWKLLSSLEITEPSEIEEGRISSEAEWAEQFFKEHKLEGASVVVV